MISYTPGRLHVARLTATMRVPGQVGGADGGVRGSTPLTSSHGRFDSVSTLLTMVGWP